MYICSYYLYEIKSHFQDELLYVNYGRVEDYDYLDTLNVNVSGKIVIARYGKIFRGDMVRTVELHLNDHVYAYLTFVTNIFVLFNVA